MRIGVLHPGEMGAAMAALLVNLDHQVTWVPGGRSPETAARASEAGLVGVASLEALTATSELILSICPPDAALDVAGSVAACGFAGVFVDANAIAPTTARAVAAVVEGAGARYVDGGIIGAPPLRPGTTRFYLSGPDATAVSELWVTPILETHVIGDEPTAASALKLAYASWTKGSSALLLAAREAADAEGVGTWLMDEWRTSQPELTNRLAAARRNGTTKGWRWVGEMEEIATMFAADGLPDGFHLAAADMWRRAAGLVDQPGPGAPPG